MALPATTGRPGVERISGSMNSTADIDRASRPQRRNLQCGHSAPWAPQQATDLARTSAVAGAVLALPTRKRRSPPGVVAAEQSFEPTSRALSRNENRYGTSAGSRRVCPSSDITKSQLLSGPRVISFGPTRPETLVRASSGASQREGGDATARRISAWWSFAPQRTEIGTIGGGRMRRAGVGAAARQTSSIRKRSCVPTSAAMDT